MALLELLLVRVFEVCGALAACVLVLWCAWRGLQGAVDAFLILFKIRHLLGALACQASKWSRLRCDNVASEMRVLCDGNPHVYESPTEYLCRVMATLGYEDAVDVYREWQKVNEPPHPA